MLSVLPFYQWENEYKESLCNFPKYTASKEWQQDLNPCRISSSQHGPVLHSYVLTYLTYPHKVKTVSQPVVSDSLPQHRLSPTRLSVHGILLARILECSHFLLQGSCTIFICVHAKPLQLCPTLCNPLGCSPPGSKNPWDSPGKITEVGYHALPRGSSQTRDWTHISYVSCTDSWVL